MGGCESNDYEPAEVRYYPGVLAKYQDCSEGDETSISEGTAGHDIMKLHITNNRVGKVLREKQSQAKGIKQKVLHEDSSQDLLSMLNTIEVICQQDSSMSSLSKQRLLKGAKIAFGSPGCNTIEETIEFSDQGNLHINFYFMCIVGKGITKRCTIILTQIKLVKVEGQTVYRSQVYSSEAIGAEGGCGGKPYQQLPNNQQHMIRKFMVRYGDIIDRIQITTGTIDNDELEQYPILGIGGGGCQPRYFTVPAGVLIDGVRVHIANWGRLKVAQGFDVHLSNQNSSTWETIVPRRSDHAQLRYLHTKVWSDKGFLIGIHGRSGDVIDALGFYFGNN